MQVAPLVEEAVRARVRLLLDGRRVEEEEEGIEIRLSPSTNEEENIPAVSLSLVILVAFNAAF